MNNSKLKFKPRKKIYESANCTFDPETKIAKSYHWWIFVAEIQGMIVFNDYSYSPTTARHQYLVKRLLSELGIEIDLVINKREGLQAIQDVKSKKELIKIYKECRDQDLKDIEAKEQRQRERANKQAKARRLALKLTREYLG